MKEADGTTRIVEYHADKHNGFNAVVKNIGHPHHQEDSHHNEGGDHGYSHEVSHQHEGADHGHGHGYSHHGHGW